jgi:hypothetical protein
MTTIRLAPGANIITGSTHGGIDRITGGVAQLSRLISSSIRTLDTWRQARIDAHNDAMLVEVAAHDPRILAELRAAQGRARG